MSGEPEFESRMLAVQQRTARQSADKALQALVEFILERWQPEAVSIARVEADDSLIFHVAAGRMADRIVGLRLPPGCGIASWVVQRGCRLWVPDVTVDDRFYAEIDRKTGFCTKAVLALPLMVDHDVLAVLEFINPNPETDMRAVDHFVTTLALLTAPSLANVKLAERVDQAEMRYAGLFECNLDPIVVLDMDGRVLEANRMAQSVLSLCLDDVEHVDLERLGFGCGNFGELRESAQTHGAVTWEFQLPEQDRFVEARLSYLPACLPGGGTYLWIGHDVTDRVNLERERQKFTHMIVHDLRAPLSSVQNSMELVLTAWREQDVTMPIEQVLGIGLRSANRMEQLISDILDSAALQVNERALRIVEIRIDELVHEAVEVVSSSVGRRKQHLSVELMPGLSVVSGDVDLLRRVLINLLTNAVKFTQDKGELLVRVDADENEVRFAVIDNGPGIVPELQDSVFKLYARGSNRKVRGTGIGLAFCKLAVEAHGGRIWFETEQGKGSSFAFSIPRVLPSHVVHHGGVTA